MCGMAKEGGLSSSLLVPQRLGFGGLAVLLIVMSSLPVFAMDMFSPSIPSMTEEFHSTPSEVTLTITLFFFLFTLGLIVFGTVSDKFGRKPVLLLCMGLFTVGSALCAFASTLPMLIAFRMVEALGAGGVSAVSMALLKDVFAPGPRERFLVFMTVIQVIGPVVSPIIGAWIVTFSVWNTVFWVITGIGVACFVGICLFNETLPQADRLTESVVRSYGRMGVVLRDKAFTLFLLATAFPFLAFSGYLAVGSYLYIDQFGQSEQMYSYFFAGIAISGSIGPFIYAQLVKHINKRRLVLSMLFVPAIVFVLIMVFGHASPLAFTLCFVPLSIAGSAIRPVVTSVLLQQTEKDAGSASAIINFMNSLVTSAAMVVAPVFAPDFVSGLGVMAVVGSALSLMLWLIFTRSGYVPEGLKDPVAPEVPATPANPEE